MTRKNRNNLVQLFIETLSDLYEPNIMIETIARYFGATAAVFWRRNSFTSGEFDAKGIFNRPDLIEEDNNYFLLSDENIIFRARQSKRKIEFGELGVEPFGKRWMSKPYTRYLSEIDITHIAVCPIEDRDDLPFGAISLYFNKEILNKKTVAHELEMVGQFLYRLQKDVLEEIDAVVTEQEKMGHEISGQIDSLNGTMTNLKNYLVKVYGIETNQIDYFTEASRKTSAIRESARHKELQASLRSQRKHAIYLNPREELNFASQPIVRGISRRQVTLQSTKTNFGNVEIKISPAHFQNIITNYITNAVKYSEYGGIIQPSMHLNDDNGSLRISITSSGRGIPEEEREKIWNVKYRGQQARKRGISGLGLGLNIVAEICEAYGLKYGYDESQSGGGNMRLSTFWIQFPERDVRVGE